jgi:hypothetical protein
MKPAAVFKPGTIPDPTAASPKNPLALRMRHTLRLKLLHDLDTAPMPILYLRCRPHPTLQVVLFPIPLALS